ncbi:hypothetical protein BGX21_000927 [Mortierella sp. AD011]|nr:hypothetical protein BGX20_011449 [Mortierella sp. AD010]KAF9385945.1 hypothetical protein BGX21_000927 [Mortierella sp. AD011]
MSGTSNGTSRSANPRQEENTSTANGTNLFETTISGLAGPTEDGAGIGGSSLHTNTSDFKRQLSNATIDIDHTNDPLLAPDGTPANSTSDQTKSTSKHNHQTRLTKALLLYLSLFRVVQPLVSLGAFGTITPVLSYFRSQTIFPAIQASLYLFTATLACCSLFFSIIYFIDVIFKKPLFWPFTHRHFRQTSKARIGADLIVCMVFCGLWFLSLVGLVIDAVWVDCGRLTGLESVFLDNGRSIDKIKTVCRLEKATLGLAAVSWACWMGVLIVLLYGHFWKRRQVIASRLRERLSRRQPSQAGGVSSAISPDAGAGQPGSSVSGRSTTQPQQHPQQPSDCGCQDREGEVGLTGIICRYDDQSSLNSTIRRTEHPHATA